MKYLARAVGALLIFGLLVLLGFGVVSKAPSVRIDSRLSEQKSTVAPSFRLAVLADPKSPTVPKSLRRAVSDGWLSIAELAGLPVVLNFWSSWCAPCQEEASFLERTSRAASKDGIVFVGVNVLDITKNALEFMARYDVSYLNVRDPGLATAKRYEAKAMPETFFISRRGEIVGHAIGVVSPRQMISGLLAAKSGQPIAVSNGGARRSVEKR